MSKIAVDIVLLPDEEMTRRVIEANARLVREYGGPIVLSAADCLPHISLVMGCIEENQVGRAGKALEAIAERRLSWELRVVGVQTTAGSSGQSVSSFIVEKTNPLERLHEAIMKRMKSFLTWECTDKMIFGGPACKSTLSWINNYPVKSSHENFLPHITIGYGEYPDIPRPIQFTAVTLAICHLGDNCTCRRVLWGVATG